MNGIVCCKTNERSSCKTKEMVLRGELIFYVHSEEIPSYERVHIIVRSKKTLARNCRIGDSMFLFLAGFFFPCLLAQKKSFFLLHKLNDPNILTCLLTVRDLRNNGDQIFCLPSADFSPPPRNYVI